LLTWRTSRLANVAELRRAQGLLDTAGPGSAGSSARTGTHPVSEALILRIVTEFQGYVRDLLDLATGALVRGSGSALEHQTRLTSAMSRDRWIDRGNPHLGTVRRDAERLGIASLGSRLSARNPTHDGDTGFLRGLVELRNALAHDDRNKLRRLLHGGIRPTIGYADAAHACLDRYVRALDEVVWDHLIGLFPAVDPWSPS
jgi:hypothetical protein